MFCSLREAMPTNSGEVVFGLGKSLPACTRTTSSQFEPNATACCPNSYLTSEAAPEGKPTSWEHRSRRRTSRRSIRRSSRSEEHTSELQSRENLVCRLLLEKKKNKTKQ